MTDTYRWTARKPLRRSAGDDGDGDGDGDGGVTTVERGAVFDPTRAELRAFGDLMEPVDGDGDGDGDSGAHKQRLELAKRAADADYKDAVAAVETGEADAYLDELEDIDDRKSVQEAIAERREVM